MIRSIERRAGALLGALALAFFWLPAQALDAAAVDKLAFGDGDERIEAIGALLAAGEARVPELLRALADGELQTAGKRVLIVRGEEGTDAVTGEKVAPLPAEREEVVANNRLRSAVASALASLKFLSAERATRLEAARAFSGAVDVAAAPLLRKALEREQDAEVRSLLAMAVASLDLASEDRAIRTFGHRSPGRRVPRRRPRRVPSAAGLRSPSGDGRLHRRRSVRQSPFPRRRRPASPRRRSRASAPSPAR